MADGVVQFAWGGVWDEVSSRDGLCLSFFAAVLVIERAG